MQMRGAVFQDPLPDRAGVAENLVAITALGAVHAHELRLTFTRFRIDFTLGKFANNVRSPGRRIRRHPITISTSERGCTCEMRA